MDAIKAAFESQFGTEWSTPVVNTQEHNHSKSESDDDQFANFEDSNDEEEEEEASSKNSVEDEGPVVIKHDESHLANNQHLVTKSQRRKFMSSGAPKDDSESGQQGPPSKKDDEDLKNDLALQRLIEESHILSEGAKDQMYSGADISGAVDPLERIGKTRLKIMESRLSKAGAKTSSPRIPQAMAVGIRDKRKERSLKTKQEAREAGIVLAKERFTRSNKRTRDKGLKINTVGRASEHGIHISQAEIAKLTGKPKASKRRIR